MKQRPKYSYPIDEVIQKRWSPRTFARGRIFSLVEGLSIRGKLNPLVKDFFHSEERADGMIF
jgi:hypothetical protein